MKKRIVFIMIAMLVVFVSCKKEYIQGKKTTTTTTTDDGTNPPDGTGNWVPTKTMATIIGNQFTWDISNSSVDPNGKEIFVVWISTNGVVNYNKVLEGVSGVYSAGTITGGVITFQLNPGYTKLKFNLAVNGGPPSNTWYWFTAQGGFVQKPCQHTNSGWCYDDGTNNLFSTTYSTFSNTWIPGDPC